MSDFEDSSENDVGLFESAPALPPSEYMADQADERLDVFLSRRVLGLSRSQARRLINAGLVRVDGDLERPAYRLHFGEMVGLYQEQHRAQLAAAEEIPLDVRYEDDHVIVVNKQIGLPVHPAPGSQTGTLVNALLARWPDLTSMGDAIRPGLVHRLDKDTSGVMVVAKDVVTQAALQGQMRARTTQKHYLAVVAGVPDPREGLIDAPIGRDPSDRRRMAVVEGGKASQTEYRVRERYRDAALVECRLITGRTHQIRVHMMATGYPLLGDLIYGAPSQWIDRQALHALQLSFDHPASGKRVTVAADPPDDFEQLLSSAREDAETHGLDIHAVDTVDVEAPKWRQSRHRARHIR